MKAIIKAIISAQSEMGNAKKDANNPFFNKKYADLNAIREVCIPVLNSHNIAVLQPTAFIDGKNFVKTILLHESGETIESLTEIVYSRPNDAQAQGSGITYARRYGLQSLLNIGAEDDDGNGSSNPIPPAQTQQSSPELPWLNILKKDGSPLNPLHDKIKAKIEAGATIETIKQHYKVGKDVEKYIVENLIPKN